MNNKESKIGSLTTLLSVLNGLGDKDSFYFFRGHNSKDYSLLPSIYRKQLWYSNEDKMIREIIMRCPTEFNTMESSFEKLVKMQHYDLPTRLLDLTENPLVALYFACIGEDQKKEDGEIKFFKIPRSEVKFYDSDTVSVVSNIAWLKPDFEVAEHFGNDSQTFHDKDNHHAISLMHNIKQEKPHFMERVNPKHIQSVVCVKPKMDNPRLIRQDGAFLLFGINGNKYQPANIPEDWIYYPNQKKYIIKSMDKTKILQQLSKIGISKAKLFPEIDMVSQFIKYDYGLNEIEFLSSVKQPKVPAQRLKVHFG